MNPGGRKHDNEILVSGIESEFWQVLSDYIGKAGDPELFLKVNNEMGIKGFWYMKGYISACRDIIRKVDSAKLAANRVNKQLSPDKGELKGE